MDNVNIGIGMITYACLKFSVQLANLCQWKRPQNLSLNPKLHTWVVPCIHVNHRELLFAVYQCFAMFFPLVRYVKYIGLIHSVPYCSHTISPLYVILFTQNQPSYVTLLMQTTVLFGVQYTSCSCIVLGYLHVCRADRGQSTRLGVVLTSYMNPTLEYVISGLILGFHPANERRRYSVTTSLIGWAQA